MDIQKYQRIFTQESKKYLDELDRLLLRVEKTPDRLELWEDIHGKVHSIKGMAGALSLDRVRDLSHAVEGWCKAFQNGAQEASPAAIQTLFQSADLLRLLVKRMGEIMSIEEQKWYDGAMARLRRGPGDPGPAEPDAAVSPASINRSTVEGIDYVRVRYSLIEELLGFSQELLFLENNLPPLSLEQMSTGLKTWIDEYAAMLKGLHFRLAQLRLISVADFADLFVKTVRNLARESGKKVAFNVVGGALEADITLLERLREPFLHILRNSIAHGIESPEARVKAGKPAEGEIRLEAERKGDSLLLRLKDDGRGIDESRIVRYLKEKKSLTDGEIARMPRDAFFETILNPDFSTARETTSIAGRGIGMSVVAQAIEYLGGSMTIRSEKSKGAEFILKLPVSLSVIYAVNFILGGYPLAIPTSNVLSIDKRKTLSPEDREALYDLGAALGISGGEDGPGHLLRLKPPEGSGRSSVLVAADRIIGNRQMMVTPVGDLLARPGIFAGVGILENGNLSMLLDMESLPGTW